MIWTLLKKPFYGMFEKLRKKINALLFFIAVVIIVLLHAKHCIDRDLVCLCYSFQSLFLKGMAHPVTTN